MKNLIKKWISSWRGKKLQEWVYVIEKNEKYPKLKSQLHKEEKQLLCYAKSACRFDFLQVH